MEESSLYAKVVEWSQEDRCFVGSAPGLVYGGCHGVDEEEVFDVLCKIEDEIIDCIKGERPSRSPTAGRDAANSRRPVASPLARARSGCVGPPGTPPRRVCRVR